MKRARALGRRLACGSGQATVELVALAPMVVLLCCVGYTLFAAARASELARHAATNGAIGLLQGADPRESARESLPAWQRERAQVRVAGRRVTVLVRPRTPLGVLAGRLTAKESAVAGEAG